jgi:response regulator RpfG family c-di-GMP phosphodiesterase
LSIRTKLLTIFISILLTSLFISGVLSAYAARSGLTSVAARLLGFKAEELRKYMDNQWQLLEDNELSGRPEYVEAYRESMRSFAGSLIRSEDELILALDLSGDVVFSTADSDVSGLVVDEANGWIETSIAGQPRVGYSFLFGPLSWRVLVTDSAASFYGSVNSIVTRTATVFGVTLLGAVIIVLFTARVIAGPLVVLSRAMHLVVETGNLNARVAVVSDDETADVARSFNRMIEALDRSYEEVRLLAGKERSAREEVAQREHEALKLIGALAEFKDVDTAAHISRVGLYARLLARGVGEDEESQDLVYFASPLHDIGKLAIPDSILLKPGPLTPEEYSRMQTHAQAGYDLLAETRSQYLQIGAIIALTHHEKYDGTGYPKGTAGESIPLFGRIVGLADVFDALVSRRPYKVPWTVEEAAAYLHGEAGKHFDPELVQIFLSSMDEVRHIMETHPDP